MKIQLWFSETMNRWHWTLTSDEDTRIMESGTSEKLDNAMSDVSTTVEWLLDQQSNHFSHS